MVLIPLILVVYSSNKSLNLNSPIINRFKYFCYLSFLVLFISILCFSLISSHFSSSKPSDTDHHISCPPFSLFSPDSCTSNSSYNQSAIKLRSNCSFHLLSQIQIYYCSYSCSYCSEYLINHQVTVSLQSYSDPLCSMDLF